MECYYLHCQLRSLPHNSLLATGLLGVRTTLSDSLIYTRNEHNKWWCSHVAPSLTFRATNRRHLRIFVLVSATASRQWRTSSRSRRNPPGRHGERARECHKLSLSFRWEWHWPIIDSWHMFARKRDTGSSGPSLLYSSLDAPFVLRRRTPT